ncbi:outer membrane beta-barrel protein [Polaribacter gangjinensis]|uniref:Outer membrane protein beta-barrel domain-containing protein n=1 Tax=Polaribacter gangjinensis TaxID=574710 RepID=A0A2S7WDG8_9FLAO|nr:outer membrane beta-barrel protein [Polaribacter gangjinensis]PQJ75637.1 hypothetical protein BTO13_10530 [Polaribacter gangjinensis]
MLFFSVNFYSQKTGIKGIITDTTKQPLEMVSVALLNPKDSTLVSFASTDKTGNFFITDVPSGSFLLQINLLGYKAFSKQITYQNNLIDLQTIVLNDDVNTLNEIVIAALIPIQIKKDTVSFNASSFKVNFDDNIESLLKKLPGIEINSEGKVVSQGTVVTKIMIDGKEFFGGDPSIVLKNLSADVIKKVEIIDKKSDEEELTGVSDGNKEIVINFTLKDANKNRGFGKAAAGLGLDNRYFGNANYSQFNAKTQLSVISKFNNINITGSNIQDFLENADGVADDSDDESKSTNSPPKSLSGFLETTVIGANYGRDFQKKESLNADYFYNASENYGFSETNRISFTNTNNFNFKSKDNFLNTTQNHNFNFNYTNKTSKKNTITLKGRFFSDDRNFFTDRKGAFLNTEDELVTQNDIVSNNSNNLVLGNVNFNYFHSLRKKGRSFTVGFVANINNTDKQNTQDTYINRNVNTNNPTNQEINTFRDEDIQTNTFNFRFKFREPLVGKHYLNLDFNTNFLSGKEITDQSRKITRTTSVEDFIKFQYNHQQIITKSNLFHSYNTSKLNISSGLELQNLLRQFGQVNEPQYSTEQLFINPNFSFQYKPKTGKKYQFSYRKSIKPPRPAETNPFVNDLNPFAIITGNVALEPEKTNTFQALVNVNSYDASIGYNLTLNYAIARHAIIRNVSIDDDFIRTISYQNNGEREIFKGDSNFSKRFNKLGFRITLQNKYGFNAVNSIINFNLNNVVSQDFSTNFIIQNNKKRNVDVKAGVFYSENNTSFSIENNLNRKFTTQKYFGMIDVDLIKKLNFNTQLDYIIYDDENFGIRQELPIWNAAMSYPLANKNHILKLVLIDLLNKNVDIFRRSTINFFEETTSQSLGRYIILSYTFKLSASNKSS